MEKKKRISPYLIILLSFLIIIIGGALLLMLPIATTTHENLPFIDALFTATSAVCVTGLSSIPDIGATLTLFGKIVLAILIEIGGLGFITFAVFILILIGAKIRIKDRFLIKEALNQNTPKGVVKLVKTIVLTSLTIQAIGAVFNFLIFKFSMGFSTQEAFGFGIFHAVSSFNNAGFDLFGSTSLTDPMFANHILFNLNTAFLIISGGLGFIVIFDILTIHNWRQFAVHTKIVLVTTFFLLLFGTILLKVLQPDMTWLQAFFQSVSARTAGFATYPMNALANPAFVLFIILMFVGASPCSTGGGVKTTTFFVIIKTIVSYARGKSPIAFHRKIADASIFKAFSLVTLAIAFIATITIGIAIIEPLLGTCTEIQLSDMVFEVVSAFGTVGNSTGFTANFHWLSKLALCFTMFFGRLGPLTIISLWNRNWMLDNRSDVRYVEKQIIIG